MNSMLNYLFITSQPGFVLSLIQIEFSLYFRAQYEDNLKAINDQLITATQSVMVAEHKITNRVPVSIMSTITIIHIQCISQYSVLYSIWKWNWKPPWKNQSNFENKTKQRNIMLSPCSVIFHYYKCLYCGDIYKSYFVVVNNL